MADIALTVRYFAMIRELLGREIEHRSVPAATTASGLFDLLAADEPRLRPLKNSTMLMVNQEYVPPSHRLEDGDDVALIPPVSGGEATFGPFRVQEEPLDPATVAGDVLTEASGATVSFVGTVRDHARGRRVLALEYEAYAPAAEKMLHRIGEEMRSRWHLEGVAIVHRVGRLLPPEASIVIAVTSAHRDEAFASCRYAIERVKEIVPIWKKEFYADGQTWIGSEADYQREFSSRPAASATTGQ